MSPEGVELFLDATGIRGAMLGFVQLQRLPPHRAGLFRLAEADIRVTEVAAQDEGLAVVPDGSACRPVRWPMQPRLSRVAASLSWRFSTRAASRQARVFSTA
ncbi:hypothetical protein [Amycolatopsis aidingensis]|uniref:hypothetical protein n=1 Tax=Amycolatopsis aidingensis TaxID=2842453 RepID=UPI001C0E0BBE|nr:hypothetical protein [Amycolatopsis aidingensis]